jgi:hypothetical protein
MQRQSAILNLRVYEEKDYFHWLVPYAATILQAALT